MKTLSERILWRLAQTGKKKAGLARHVGIAAPSVTKWINGETKRLEGSNLLKAAAYLDCDPAWLSSGEGPWQVKASLRPIELWEREEDLPEDQYVFIPSLEVKLSAGDGNVIWHLDDTGQRQAYTRKWAMRMGIDPSSAATMVVSGSSMEPRYQDGDSIVVDYCQRDTVIDGKVYAISLNAEVFIKRLFKEVDGSIRIVSDNQDKTRYPDKIVTPQFMERLQIIGRVIALAGGAT
jgi:phage repressor protein C with HTH and peptisase S24 domain